MAWTDLGNLGGGHFVEARDQAEGWIARLKGSITKEHPEGWEYLPIILENGQRTHGGNQGWYRATAKVEELNKQGITKRYQLCRRDESYRLASLGCGVVAMTNAEIYLGRKLRENLSKEGYQAALKERWDKKYRIGKSYFNYLTGLYPWKMTKGLKSFLHEIGSDLKKVQWAPFFLSSPQKQRELVLQRMTDMLRADCPVVFSYHTFDPQKGRLTLYGSLEAAIRGGKPGVGDETVDSHYMTAIGLYQAKGKLIIIQTESWGRIFYVRFDGFSKRLNYFTNILSVQ